MVAKDFEEAQQNGVALDGDEVLYPVILGNKGDWSYLVAWVETNKQYLLDMSFPPMLNMQFVWSIVLRLFISGNIG